MKGKTLSFSPKVALAVAALIALVASSVAAPLISDVFATGQADLESELLVRNGSSGDFSKITDADAGDVVEVQLYYHNQEDAFTGDTAKNVRVGINIPQTAGDRHVIGSTVSADNASTQTDDALVRLASSDYQLEYVEGSAKWTHNTGYDAGDEDCKTGNDTAGAPAKCLTTESISDSVVTSSAGLVIEDARPCYAHEAWITVEVKVEAPQEPEDIKVTADVDFTEECDVENDSYTLDEKDGVIYTVNDQRVNGVGTVSVTATAEDGYQLVGESEWSYDFTNEPCEEPEEPEEPETPVTKTPETPQGPQVLASTGPAQALMAITGTGAVGQAITSFVKSRRGLLDVLKR